MLAILKRYSEWIINIMLLSMIIYGVGRLYFQVTAGFTEGNITTDLTKELDHNLPLLKSDQEKVIDSILKQPFRYLGKGCQSYVFISADRKYVIKFLKYQRFRPQAYLEAFAFLPSIEKKLEIKRQEKRKKLDALLDSWKIAYLDLKPETGLIYMHLNIQDTFPFPLIIQDKMGLRHEIDPNQVVFLVQRTADMLSAQIAKNNLSENKALLKNLITMLVSEYKRGLGDNDHALMQNTGVIENQPVHIDVGQFSKEERFKNPDVYKQEIFSKTYKFRIWLSKHYPELETYLSELLFDLIGPQMKTMKPILKTVDEGA